MARWMLRNRDEVIQMRTKELKEQLAKYERAMPSVARKRYRLLLEKAFQRLERLYDERKSLKDELEAVSEAKASLEAKVSELTKQVKDLESKLKKCTSKDGA